MSTTHRSRFWQEAIEKYNSRGCDEFQAAYFKHLAGEGPKPNNVSYGVPWMTAQDLMAKADAMHKQLSEPQPEVPR